MPETIFDLSTAISGAVAEISAQVGDTLPVVLPLAGGLLAVTIGWKYAKRFLRG